MSKNNKNNSHLEIVIKYIPPIKVERIIAYKLIFLPISNFIICHGAKLKPTKAPASTWNIKPANPTIIKITSKNASIKFSSSISQRFQCDMFVETYQPGVFSLYCNNH